MDQLSSFVVDEVEENSFKTIALLWSDLPVIANNEDLSTLKAARGSKTGFVKLVFNFLAEQDLFFESNGKYYATDRFNALVQNYFEEYRGRLYEIVTQGAEGRIWMPHINRIRVNNVKYNFGTQFYDDFVMRFDGKNALYDLANGGGKSVLMLLLFQNLIPNCTLDDKQPIEKLFRTSQGSTTIHSLWWNGGWTKVISVKAINTFSLVLCPEGQGGSPGGRAGEGRSSYRIF